MTIFDRYLISLFLKIFVICFFSFTGLFVVVHLFSNLDELTSISKEIGWAGIFSEFYLPRFAELYDKSAGVLTLVAAIFSVSLMQRRREMTAIEAGGLTKLRILRSIFILSTGLIALTVVNREVLIPMVKDQLVRTPQSWGVDGQVDMMVQTDHQSGVVIRGDQLLIGENKITSIHVQLPVLHNGRPMPPIEASYGIVAPADSLHPKGIWLYQVRDRKSIIGAGSRQDRNGNTILYSPADATWLGPDQCFVSCDFDVEQMAYGKEYSQYQSTWELIKASRKPKRWSAKREQVGIHARLVRPIMDLTLLWLGLPLVIGGIERNVFVSAGLCFWIIAIISLSNTVCYSLGVSSLIRPAALAAWLPVMMFVPLAVVALRRLRR